MSPAGRDRHWKSVLVAASIFGIQLDAKCAGDLRRGSIGFGSASRVY